MPIQHASLNVRVKIACKIYAMWLAKHMPTQMVIIDTWMSGLRWTLKTVAENILDIRFHGRFSIFIKTGSFLTLFYVWCKILAQKLPVVASNADVISAMAPSMNNSVGPLLLDTRTSQSLKATLNFKGH